MLKRVSFDGAPVGDLITLFDVRHDKEMPELVVSDATSYYISEDGATRLASIPVLQGRSWAKPCCTAEHGGVGKSRQRNVNTEVIQKTGKYIISGIMNI
jgi:hypothetical protein